MRQGARSWRSAVWAMGAVWAMVVLVAGLAPAMAATNERVVSDHHTGLALWGYDPVAYHLDGRPRQGRAEHELRHAGLTWRFVNAGNLAAFQEQPAAYMPAFGGYDPTAVARKAAAPGNPEVFAVWNGKLLLFRNEASRERFFTDPASLYRAAAAGWDEAVQSLPR